MSEWQWVGKSQNSLGGGVPTSVLSPWWGSPSKFLPKGQRQNRKSTSAARSWPWMLSPCGQGWQWPSSGSSPHPRLASGAGSSVWCYEREVGGEREDHMLNPLIQLPLVCAFAHPPGASESACFLLDRPSREGNARVKHFCRILQFKVCSLRWKPGASSASSTSICVTLWEVPILHIPCPTGVWGWDSLQL